MNHFHYLAGEMHCESVALSRIAADVGTPTYVYSSATIERHATVFRDAVKDCGCGNSLVAYAVKANTTGALLKLIADCGLGADIVSGGELIRARRAGIPADKIVYSGVGKNLDEMELALREGIYQFNFESEEEAEMLSRVATRLGMEARVAFRVNPDVEAGTHAKISTGGATDKFGIPAHRIIPAYRRAMELPGLKVQGIAVHIGSQLTDLEPLRLAYQELGRMIAELRAEEVPIQVADLGGGLGVPYVAGDPSPPSPEDYGRMVAEVTAGWDVRLVFEPGRVIVGNAGVLLTRVMLVKEGQPDPFVVVDAGMNDLMRPAMYDAWHDVFAVRQQSRRRRSSIVGPVCESSDVLAKSRDVEEAHEGDLLAIMTAGAYGAVMASNYNSRGRPAEVLVRGGEYAVIRERETLDDVVRNEVAEPVWTGEQRSAAA
ncbi:diaminopimelate decarboxylase [Sphingomonas piscis]|uniref:Diaminopimelate decarboxylase n=1 Tax=Sphingomonas piscis TaxID=2714943 RepID=A0A6G7YNJ8_9SPHN|nr:diaminopimelate decarboxylase [Sphingomonas piscis]QIK78296.1 diaminopimelate decarboxylase [Sphingomonas piscis]